MMKKVFVLLLVLAMTSLASASMLDLVITSWGPGPDPVTQPIDPTKNIVLHPSEWINMDIFYVPEAPGVPPLQQLSVEISVNGPGTLDLSDLTEPDGAWDAMFSEGVTEIDPGKVYTLRYNLGFFGQGVADGIAIDHILFHCDGIGDVTITIRDYVKAGAGSQDAGGNITDFGAPVVIDQVPEPMTVALLGLGGLLLRRRK
jgi:hypothetical protein